jgi:hypothetical protein
MLFILDFSINKSKEMAETLAVDENLDGIHYYNKIILIQESIIIAGERVLTSIITTDSSSHTINLKAFEESPSPCWDSNLVFAPTALKNPRPTNNFFLNYKPSPRPVSWTDTAHEGKPAPCLQIGCGKIFKSRSHLLRHERMHSGEVFLLILCDCLETFSVSLSKLL